jgi:hypothetical protein
MKRNALPIDGEVRLPLATFARHARLETQPLCVLQQRIQDPERAACTGRIDGKVNPTSRLDPSELIGKGAIEAVPRLHDEWVRRAKTRWYRNRGHIEL